MKKLKLKALDLSAKEILTREQLKKILGGSDGGSGSGDGKCETKCKCPKGHIVRDGVTLPTISVYPCTVCKIEEGVSVTCSDTKTTCSFPKEDCIKVDWA